MVNDMTDEPEKQIVPGFSKQQLMSFYFFIMCGDSEFMPHHRKDFLGVKWCAQSGNQVSSPFKTEAHRYKTHRLYPKDREWLIEFTSMGNLPVKSLRKFDDAVWYQGSYQWLEMSEPTITGDIEQFKAVGAMVLLFESEWEQFTHIPDDTMMMIRGGAGMGKTSMSFFGSGVGVGKSMFFNPKLAAQITATGQKTVRSMSEAFRKLGGVGIDEESVDKPET
jgi:hypothetical protein